MKQLFSLPCHLDHRAQSSCHFGLHCSQSADQGIACGCTDPLNGCRGLRSGDWTQCGILGSHSPDSEIRAPTNAWLWVVMSKVRSVQAMPWLHHVGAKEWHKARRISSLSRGFYVFVNERCTMEWFLATKQSVNSFWERLDTNQYRYSSFVSTYSVVYSWHTINYQSFPS